MGATNTVDSEMDIPSYSVQEIVETLSTNYLNAIQRGQGISKISSVFLWGAPGIGKTQSVYEISEVLEKETGKKAVVTVIRLNLYSPLDAKGMPVKVEVTSQNDEEKRQLVEWIRPRVFDLNPSEDVINIMFLDELSAVESKSVKQVAYEIALDHTVGEHKLPDNTIIIAAGNRTSDRSIAYPMERALSNRMAHFHIKEDAESWNKWAVRNSIHPLVIGYLSCFPHKLLCEPKNKNAYAYPSPRTWEMLSENLYIYGVTEKTMLSEAVQKYVGGIIGVGAAFEFCAWCDVYRSIPSARDICEGCQVPYPNKQDALYALVSSLISYVTEKVISEEGVSRWELENLCRYVERFPVDFLVLLYSDLMNIPGLRKKLIMVPSFREWMNRTRR